MVSWPVRHPYINISVIIFPPVGFLQNLVCLFITLFSIICAIFSFIQLFSRFCVTLLYYLSVRIRTDNSLEISHLSVQTYTDNNIYASKMCQYHTKQQL